MLKLRFNDGSRPSVWLTGERVTIGADRSNLIWLRQPLIEPFHAEIMFGNGKAYLLNLEPTHRTGVNGTKVVKAVQLAADDRITLGRTEMTILDQPSPASRPVQSVAFQPAGGSADQSTPAQDDQAAAQRPEQVSFEAVLAELDEEQKADVPSGKSSYALIMTLVMVTLAVISTVLVLTDALNWFFGAGGNV